MEVKKGDTIAVWFSCGVASAIAAKKTIEKYGDMCKIRILNNPIKEEHKDNMRFLKDVEKWLGYPIEFVVNKKYPNSSCVEVWEHKKFMSSPQGANCTRILKKNARHQWEQENKWDWIVLGFTAEEQKRYDNFILSERKNLLPVLIEDGITKQDCFYIISEAKIPAPAIYGMGFPNANCIGCVKATSPTYWNLVREVFPEVFDARAKQSKKIGTKLVRHKGQRIFLDELPSDAKGYDLKNYDVECGVFCEVKWL